MEETEALVAGVERCGGGKWAEIKKLCFAAIERRSPVDLKDKWRNLLRVALPSLASKWVFEFPRLRPCSHPGTEGPDIWDPQKRSARRNGTRDHQYAELIKDRTAG